MRTRGRDSGRPTPPTRRSGSAVHPRRAAARASAGVARRASSRAATRCRRARPGASVASHTRAAPRSPTASSATQRGVVGRARACAAREPPRADPARAAAPARSSRTHDLAIRTARTALGRRPDEQSLDRAPRSPPTTRASERPPYASQRQMLSSSAACSAARVPSPRAGLPRGSPIAHAARAELMAESVVEHEAHRARPARSRSRCRIRVPGQHHAASKQRREAHGRRLEMSVVAPVRQQIASRAPCAPDVGRVASGWRTRLPSLPTQRVPARRARTDPERDRAVRERLPPGTANPRSCAPPIP